MNGFSTSRQFNGKSGRIILMGLFIAVSTVIQYFENQVCPPAGPFRPGIANIITVSLLSLFGLPEALTVTLCRCILSGMLSGKLLSLPFFLSISGGVASTLLMGALFRIRGKDLTLIGISIMGAVCHNMIQLLIIYILVMKNQGVLLMVPWLMISALVTGLAVGYGSVGLIRLVERITPFYSRR